MARGAVGEQHQLVPPLGQRDEQRQQNRADEQPVADDDVDHHGARDRAQDESDRNRQHVDDDDVLERAGVERLEDEIARGDAAETPTERECAARAAAPMLAAATSADGDRQSPAAIGRRRLSG